jgi:hypothetical protein
MFENDSEITYFLFGHDAQKALEQKGHKKVYFYGFCF